MPRPVDRLCIGLALLCPAAFAVAQTAGALRVEGRIGASLQISDDFGSGVDGHDGGALLTVTPGIRLGSQSRSLQYSLDYGASLVKGVRLQQQPRSLQHHLRADAQANSVETGLGLAAQASISQQAQSAFGVQRDPTTGARFADALQNQGEVYTASLAPSWRFRLGRLASAELSHRATATNTRGSSLGDSNSQDTQLAVTGAGSGVFGWSVLGTQAQTNISGGRDYTTQRALLQLSWQPDIDWRFTVNGGRERSDLNNGVRETGSNYGGSLSWQPSPRTQLSASGDKRLTDNLYSFSLNHRFVRAGVGLSASRSINNPGARGAQSSSTYYDLLFAQFALQEPDPVRRDALVREALRQMGLNPETVITGGFISSRPMLTEQQSLSGSYQTQRGSWSLALTRSLNRPLGAASTGAQDDFSRSTLIRTLGLHLGVGYRLTPDSSLSTNASWQRNSGDRAELQTDLKSLTLSWSTSLGPRRQASLLARHSKFSSSVRPYDENTIIASVQQQF